MGATTRQTPSPFDVAVYARDMAGHLAGMAEEAGFAGLAVLFHAAAHEAAEAAIRSQARERAAPQSPEDAA